MTRGEATSFGVENLVNVSYAYRIRVFAYSRVPKGLASVPLILRLVNLLDPQNCR